MSAIPENDVLHLHFSDRDGNPVTHDIAYPPETINLNKTLSKLEEDGNPDNLDLEKMRDAVSESIADTITKCFDRLLEEAAGTAVHPSEDPEQANNTDHAPSAKCHSDNDSRNTMTDNPSLWAGRLRPRQ
jgi:hypothetical protein